MEPASDHICILCYENCEIFGVGKCNHNQVCYLCTIKSRIIMKNYFCPICKENLDKVIFTKEYTQGFEKFDLRKFKEYKEGILYDSTDVLEEVQKLNQHKCWLRNCQSLPNFNSVGNLKKHLKDVHYRELCEICLENKTALLKEQLLYTRFELDKHKKKGDYDEDGNLVFFHPHCQFCDKYFYNEDHFQKHLQTAHFKCELCGDQHKYRYYDSLPNLQIHFNLSHYMCQVKSCIEKGFIAFKTLAELELHNNKYHSNQAESTMSKGQQKALSYNLQSITGFTYETESDRYYKKREEKVQLNDQEGVDFQQQFFSQRKTHLRAIFEHIDQQKDGLIDLRDIYNRKYNERDLDDFLNMDEQDDGYYKSGRGGRGHRRGGRRGGNNYNSRNQYAQKGGDSEVIFLEDACLTKFNHIPHMKIDEFEKRFCPKLNQEQFEDYKTSSRDFFEKKITAEQFLNACIDIFSPRLHFKIFPLFIATIQNYHTKEELDMAFLESLKMLPKRVDCLANSSLQYSEYFNKFMDIIEQNILNRIKSQRFVVDDDYKVEKSRTFQMIEILRRVKTEEMVKLKFLPNFSVSQDTIRHITQNVYLLKLDEIHSGLDKISLDEIMHLYMYVRMCSDILMGKKIHKEKKQISSHILRDYYKKYENEIKPYRKKPYQAESEKDSSDEGEKKIEKKAGPSKKGTKSSKSQIEPNQEEEKENPDAGCVYEFPKLKSHHSINSNKSSQKPGHDSSSHHNRNDNVSSYTNNLIHQDRPKTVQKKVDIKATTHWEKNENPFLHQKKKALEEIFPTLAPEKKTDPEPQNKQKNWGDLLKPVVKEDETIKKDNSEWSKTGEEEFYDDEYYVEDLPKKKGGIGKKGKTKNQKVYIGSALSGFH